MRSLAVGAVLLFSTAVAAADKPACSDAVKAVFASSPALVKSCIAWKSGDKWIAVGFTLADRLWAVAMDSEGGKVIDRINLSAPSILPDGIQLRSEKIPLGHGERADVLTVAGDRVWLRFADGHLSTAFRYVDYDNTTIDRLDRVSHGVQGVKITTNRPECDDPDCRTKTGRTISTDASYHWTGTEFLAPKDKIWKMPQARVRAVVASSELVGSKSGTRYVASRVLDGDPYTAWEEGAEGPGVGETLTVTLVGPMQVTGVDLIAGCGAKASAFKQNPRISRVEVELSDGTKSTADLKDVADFQTIPISGKTTSIKLKVLDVFKGAAFEDGCISEVEVNGALVPSRNLDADFATFIGLKKGDDAKHVEGVLGPLEKDRSNFVHTHGIGVGVDDRGLFGMNVEKFDEAVPFLATRKVATDVIADLSKATPNDLMARYGEPASMDSSGLLTYKIPGGVVNFRCGGATQPMQSMWISWTSK
jgi:hypothetical protein